MPQELPHSLQYGAFGLLCLVLWWVGNRLLTRLDNLDARIEKEIQSNERLARIILLALIKFKNPSVDLSDEANQFLHESDDNKQNK